MARINRRPSANRRSTLVDPKKGASGSIAEEYRSSILGAPDEFRKSSFDPDAASFDELRARSGEIATAMEPAPEELAFSDTGEIRDVWRQGMPDLRWLFEGFGEVPKYSDAGGGTAPAGLMGPMGPEPPKFRADAPAFGTPEYDKKMADSMAHDWASGKDVTTGRILREHPDKFTHTDDPEETGGRFFERVPAILRRMDLRTAKPFSDGDEDYGKPGGFKYVPDSEYFGRDKSDPYFIGI
jgi:hypothetical protein